MNVTEIFLRRGVEAVPVFAVNHLWAKLWTRTAARVGIVVGIGLLIFVSVYPFVSPFAPDEQIVGAKLLAPSFSHPFGTDQFGRDQLTRIADGGRRSLGAAILALSLILFGSIAAGTFFGMVGGWLDALAMRVIDVFLALPLLVLALALIGVFGSGFENLLLAVVVSSMAFYTRLARSYARLARDRKDVIVARLSGIGWAKIVAGHVFPQIFAQMLIVATLDLGGIIVTLASLSFLGLGVQPPAAEWGAMLAEARSFFTFAPWLLLAPTLAIFVSVTAANLIGNALRDAAETH